MNEKGIEFEWDAMDSNRRTLHAIRLIRGHTTILHQPQDRRKEWTNNWKQALKGGETKGTFSSSAPKAVGAATLSVKFIGASQNTATVKYNRIDKLHAP